MLLYTYISRFSVNPHYQQMRKIRRNCCHKFYPQPFLIAFFSLSHKRPTFAFTGKSGYTFGFPRKIVHNGSHGETGGISDGGSIAALGAFRAFANLPGPGIRTAYFAALGAWSRVLPKNAESLRPVCIQLVLVGWKDLTRRSGRVTITRNNRTDNRLALVWKPHWAVQVHRQG